MVETSTGTDPSDVENRPEDGFTVEFTARLEYSSDEVENFGMSPTQAKRELLRHVRREGAEAGGFDIIYHNEPSPVEEASDGLEPKEVGIWFVIPDDGSVGRSWLLPTTDGSEARELLGAWVASVDGARVYFEGTLAESLTELSQDGGAKLAE